MEIYKNIKGFNGKYQISNFGNVRKLKNNKWKKLKGGEFSNGYKFVSLTISYYNYKRFLIHRLVADVFLPKIEGKNIVNHKDGNKQNNHVDNLEWCNQSENLKHAIEIGLVENQCKIRRKVKIKNENEEIIFKSMTECSKFFGFGKAWIHNRIRYYGNPFIYKDYSILVSER